MRTLDDAMDAVDRRIAAAATCRDTGITADADGLCLTATGTELMPLLAGTDVDGRALMRQIHTDTMHCLARLALSPPGEPFPVIGGALLSMFLLGWEIGHAAAEAESA